MLQLNRSLCICKCKEQERKEKQRNDSLDSTEASDKPLTSVLLTSEKEANETRLMRKCQTLGKSLNQGC